MLQIIIIVFFALLLIKFGAVVITVLVNLLKLIAVFFRALGRSLKMWHDRRKQKRDARRKRKQAKVDENIAW